VRYNPIFQEGYMLLPLTYYDVVSRRRRRFAACATCDADDLLKAGRTAPVNDLTAFPNRHEEALQYCVNELIRQTASISGESEQRVREEFASNPEAQAQINAFMEPLAIDYYALLNFALFGKKVFYLHDGLIQRLACTEMNVTCPFLQLPFPACMFVFTSREAIDALYRLEAGAPNSTDKIDYATPVTVFVMMTPAKSFLESRRLGIIAAHANQSHTYKLVKRNLMLVDEWNLEQALATNWTELYNLQHGITGSLATNGADGQVWKPISDDIFFNEGLLFFRLILNAALYISSADAQLQPGSSVEAGIAGSGQSAGQNSRHNQQQSKQRLSSLGFISVGAQIPIASPDGSEPCLSADRRGLSVRFTVRGHWRHQACGPNFQNRTLKFIQPYKKGPEMADLINKPYLVK
jgi:hypothetical protein